MARSWLFAPVILVGLCIGFAGSPAFAIGPEQDLIRVEAELSTIDRADALKFAEQTYRRSNLRLNEARAAMDAGDEGAAVRRLEEAKLQAEIVRAVIKLGQLAESEAQLRRSIDILRQEISS